MFSGCADVVLTVVSSIHATLILNAFFVQTVYFDAVTFPWLIQIYFLQSIWCDLYSNSTAIFYHQHKQFIIIRKHDDFNTSKTLAFPTSNLNPTGPNSLLVEFDLEPLYHAFINEILWKRRIKAFDWMLGLSNPFRVAFTESVSMHLWQFLSYIRICA